MATLKYPLTNRDQYKARIRFTRQKATKPTLTASQVSRNQQTQSSDNLEQSTTAGSTFKDFAFGSFHGGGYQTTGDAIELYMPQGVQIQDAVNFDNKDLGIRGAGALQGARSEGGVGVTQLAAAALPLGDITAITAALKGDTTGQVARTLASGIASSVGDKTSATVSSITGVVTNPNTRSVFQGVPIRKFNFSFILIPTSAAEQKEIQRIVQKFRSILYPSQISAGGVPIGFEFPDRFLIKMLWNGSRVGPDFLPCHLEGVNATYNGQSQAFYDDGGFSQVDLSLNFTEVRAMTKEDIDFGISSTGNTNSGHTFNEYDYAAGGPQ